ncbi:hypothetical protein [uncultured Microbacterium sp.]|uniref:hypothetical protein n=1 Tax=uncultured Microbacterium sp. TaxID=191216 RepID=UPI00262562B1|nr:hypothetical protein [uncultured Microbacterium sp.]
MTVESDDPGLELGESVIEQLFRTQFIERAQTLGAQTAQRPSDWGDEVEVRFPHDWRIWVLRPQVPLGMTRPDFVLEPSGAPCEPIAIFTDGKRWHAHPDSNKLREDSEKRRAARGLGYRVIAVTWNDLHGHALDKSWFDRSWTEKVAPTYGIPTAQLSRLTDDPLTSLMQWMASPDDERSRRAAIARALPLMARGTTTVASVSGDADSSLARLAASVLQGNTPVHGPKEWVTAHGPLAIAGRLGALGATDIALVIDDRAEALLTADFDRAWRLWLHLSNVIGWRDPEDTFTITTVGGVATGAGVGPVDVALFELTPEWARLTEHAIARERRLLARFAQAGLPLPTLGTETGDGFVLSLAWADAKVAVAWGLTEDDIKATAADGWTVLDADAADLETAVTASMEG